MPLEGFTPYRPEDAEKYNRLKWWAGLTFGDLIDKAAHIYPTKVALVDGEVRLSFDQVREMVDRIAVRLKGQGIRSRDCVLVQIPNWHEFVLAYFALQKIGAIPVLLIPRYREYEVNHLARLTEAKAWVLPRRHGSVDYLPIARAVQRKNPRLEHIIFVRGEDQEGFHCMGTFIKEGEGPREDPVELAGMRPDPMEVAHMGPTGGTTGLPKVVPRTHNDYLCRVEYAARAWELSHLDRMLLAAPVTHDLAFSIGLCSTLFTFGRTVMLDSTDPERICKTIQDEQITTIAWPPTLAHRLIHFEGIRDYDLSSLRAMYCGGGISSPHLVREVSSRLGCHVLNGYGGTEGMSTLPRLEDDLERKCRTVGRPTCPYDEYRVVDGEGRPLPTNRAGELVVKGPCIFTGYLKMPEENTKVFDQEGFFRTGDQAMIDDSGDIVLTGRIKDIIVRGGENISPAEMEELIAVQPGVAAVAVIGMPDPVMGERACAYIQPEAGAEIDLETVVSFLRGKGASVLQLPERVEIIQEMPRTGPKGLVDKSALVLDIKRKLDMQ